VQCELIFAIKLKRTSPHSAPDVNTEIDNMKKAVIKVCWFFVVSNASLKMFQDDQSRSSRLLRL
jgi:hypothetical protein